MITLAKMGGKDIFYLAGLVAAAYAVYKISDTLGSLADFDASKFYKGLTFNPASLGPPVELTPDAQARQTDWIERGFLEILPNGSTRITAYGQAYISEQNAQ